MIYLFFLLSQTPVYTMDGITITASVMDELPYDVEIISDEQMQKWGVKDLKEALEYAAGVNFSDYGYAGALKTAKIGGGTAAQTLVLIDGVPANNPSDGSFDLSSIPISMVKSIEIIKGSGSIFKGSNAVNGIINIITKNKGKYTNLSSYGSWNTVHTALNIGDSISGITFGILPVYKTSDGFRENTALNMQGIGTYLSGYGVDVKSHYIKKKIGVPGPAIDDTIYAAYSPNDWQKDVIKNATVSYKKVFQKTMIGTKLFYKSNYTFFHSELRGESEYYNLKYGGEVVDVYSPFTVYLGVTADSVAGAFAAFKTDMYASFEFVPEIENVYPFFAVRVDKNSQFGFFPTYSVGIKYKIGDNAKVFFSFAKAFRAPSMNELYYPVYGNESLGVETSDAYTVGAEGYGINLSFTHREVVNMIFSDPSNYKPANISQYNANVVDLSYKKNIENFLVNGGLNYLIANELRREVIGADSSGMPIYDDVKKKAMYYPPISAHLTLGYATENISGNITARYTDERYTSSTFINLNGALDSSKIVIPAFYILNLHIESKIIDGVKITFDVKNLLDRKYSAWFGYLPSNYYSGDKNYPGAPRSFYLSLIYNK